MNHSKIVVLLLKISIASVFLYAAIAATIEPFNWIGYFPQFLRNIFPTTLLLPGFSLFQALLALWILSGWKLFYSASLAALTLLGIIAANITQVDILFRDFAIFFTALALAISAYPQKKR